MYQEGGPFDYQITKYVKSLKGNIKLGYQWPIVLQIRDRNLSFLFKTF